MLNPIRLCFDLFDEPALSDSNLQLFTEDHLIRLANNNPGAIYSLLIADITARYDAYFGKMSSEATRVAFREGLTITKNNTRKTAEEKLSQVQGLVKFKFGEDSPTYQEFYPQGMEEYYQAKDGELELKFGRFKEAAVLHLTADFPLEVAAVTTVVNAYNLAYTTLRNEISLIANTITGKNTDRKLLTVQLTKGFLIIASNNIDNPDAFDDYYDPQYLPIHVSEGETVVVLEATAAAGANANFPLTGINPDKIVSILFETKDSNGQWYAAVTLNAEPDVPGLNMLPNQSTLKTATQVETELGFDETHTFLTVKNTGVVAGNYKVTITVAA